MGSLRFEGVLRLRPTEAKTYYQDELVVCLLRGGVTRVEQTLHEGGRLDAVAQQRLAFQEVMSDRFKAVVEQATGRRVIGFMSGYQQEPDMICEVFILAPEEDDPEQPWRRALTERGAPAAREGRHAA